MLQYYKENYREYIELIIAMELGFDCDYFKVSKEKQDEMFYNFLDTETKRLEEELSEDRRTL